MTGWKAAEVWSALNLHSYNIFTDLPLVCLQLFTKLPYIMKKIKMTYTASIFVLSIWNCWQIIYPAFLVHHLNVLMII
jgi:hypothetical protein